MPYKNLEEVNPVIRGIDPPVTLEQANKIAAMADSIGGDGGWAIAISAFKKGHVIDSDNKCWNEKKKSMTCPECGEELDYMDTKCKGCGAEIVYEDEKEGYQTKLKPGDFLVVENPDARSTWHMPITKVPDGEPDRALCGAAWAALHEGFRGNAYTGPKKQAAVDKLIAIYKKMDWELPSTKELEYGIKSLGDNRILLWSTNAFEDDEGEIFATKALENYVERKDIGIGSRGRVWFWHVPGTDFADIEWQGVVGRYLVEVAKYDNTPYAAAMKEALEHAEKYPELLPHGWGLSHGYLYRASDKVEGVYSFLEKYETSVLPLHRASNKLTMMQGVKSDMAISEEKKKALASLVGDALAEEVLTGTSEASDMLEKLGAAFKEKQEEKGMKKKVVEEELEEEELTEDAEELEEEEEVEKPRRKKKEAAESEDSEVGVAAESEVETESESVEDEEWEMELDEDAVKALVSQVPVEAAVKEAIGSKDFQTSLRKAIAQELKAALPGLLQAMIGTKEEIAKEALTGRITLKPYSPSQATDNIVDMGEKAKKAPETPDVIAQVVSNMLSGRG